MIRWIVGDYAIPARALAQQIVALAKPRLATSLMDLPDQLRSLDDNRHKMSDGDVNFDVSTESNNPKQGPQSSGHTR